jgi:hypothetical protein
MAKFWSRVDKNSSSGCWNWTGSINNSGYGQLWIDGEHITPHVYVWKITRKCSVPDGKCILHLCDNRKCCNPDHLYCGTYTDNIMDKLSRNPSSNIGCPKLHEGEIWLIRRLKIEKYPTYRIRQQYKFSMRFVSKMFRVAPSTIYLIWNSDLVLSKEGTYV